MHAQMTYLKHQVPQIYNERTNITNMVIKEIMRTIVVWQNNSLEHYYNIVSFINDIYCDMMPKYILFNLSLIKTKLISNSNLQCTLYT